MKELTTDQTERNESIYRLALDTYGIEAQTMMVFEEMSELQKELCKHARGKENITAIAEEIADVLVMLDQMILYFGIGEGVAEFKKFKITRLQNRLEGRCAG